MEKKFITTNSNKKGQVTIFVIIGVILILVVTFLLSNSKLELFESKETKLINQVSDIVDSCIKINSEQGLFILGMQGGFIELDRTQLAVPRSYIDLGFKIPSWEILPNRVPTISSMEQELNEYVINNAGTCISSNLEALNDIFDFEDFKTLQINSKINQNNVVVESNFPITFSEKNSEEVVSIESYFLKIDNNNLGDLYNLGIEIYSTEQQQDILSNLVMDQIYSSSDYSTSQSMPTEGLSFSCAKRIWTKSKLKDNLIDLNNNNFKFLYFDGTMPITELYDSTFNGVDISENAAGYYENFYTFTLEDTQSSFSNYKVEISMPINKNGNYFQKDRFRKFEITPNDGELIQSTDMKVNIGIGSIPIPCVQLFHHLYTLDYDLLVKITDYSEEGNKNIFQFPLRVQINNNAPSSEIPFTLPSVSQDNKLTATDSKFCAEENRLRPETIYVSDMNTQDTIKGANVKYECISLSCDVGTTDRERSSSGFYTTAKSYLITKLPYCIGGTLTAEKEGYFSTKEIIDTSTAATNQKGYREIKLIPKKSFQLTDNSVYAGYVNGSVYPLRTENDGMMFISIKNEEYDFQSQGLWPTEEGIMDTLEFLELDGITYDVSVILTDKDYELVGIFELKNWTADIHQGNSIKIIIPSTPTPLKEERFMDFYESSNELVSEESDLAELISIDFGIRFQ
jgi:hypothetical protein